MSQNDSYYNDDQGAGIAHVHNIATYVLDVGPLDVVPMGLYNAYPYVMQISMGNQGYAAHLFLINQENFTDEQVQKHLRTASGLAIEMNMKTRRAGLSIRKGATKQELDEANQIHFNNDCTLIETILCDKYNYRILQPTTARHAIEPTIKIAA